MEQESRRRAVFADLDHGLWQISVPDRTSGQVELAYVRQGPDGRPPGIPLPIGALSAAAEAMLLVEVYEGGAAPGPVADLAAARGFTGRGSELVLPLPGGAECVLEVGPEAVSFRITGSIPVCVGRMLRPRPRDGFVAFERPPGVEDPEALDAEASSEILDIRRARDFSGPREPVTMDELDAWRRARRRRSGHWTGKP